MHLSPAQPRVRPHFYPPVCEPHLTPSTDNPPDRFHVNTFIHGRWETPGSLSVVMDLLVFLLFVGEARLGVAAVCTSKPSSLTAAQCPAVCS